MRTTACFYGRRTSRIVRKEKIQADAAVAHSEILSVVINCDTRTVRLLPKYATLQTYVYALRIANAHTDAQREYVIEIPATCLYDGNQWSGGWSIIPSYVPNYGTNYISGIWSGNSLWKANFHFVSSHRLSVWQSGRGVEVGYRDNDHVQW